jgi:hypothetical protein
LNTEIKKASSDAGRDENIESTPTVATDLTSVKRFELLEDRTYTIDDIENRRHPDPDPPFDDQPLPTRPLARADIWRHSLDPAWVTPEGFKIYARCKTPVIYRVGESMAESVSLGTLSDDVRLRLIDDIEEAQHREFGGPHALARDMGEDHNPRAAALWDAIQDGRPINLHTMTVPDTDPEPDDLENFVTLDQLIPPDQNPELELLQSRFLCRGGAMFINGPTGKGKSSIVAQAVILWSLGRPAFGITPTRPLKSVIIQAENDSGDCYEMVHGIMRGCELDDCARLVAMNNVIIGQENAVTGLDLCERIRALCERHEPDLIVLDPLLAYAGVDLQRDAAGVSKFLRTWLQPILTEFGCALIVVHHTPKPPRNQKGNEWRETDYAYAGSGSAELANWPRAVLTLDETDHPGTFRLIAAKRGNRLAWQSGGLRTLTKYVRHATNGLICWQEVDESEIPAVAVKRAKTVEDIVAHVPATGSIPKNALIVKVGELQGSAKIGRDKAKALIDEALNSGALVATRSPRATGNVTVMISRPTAPPQP